jgi:glycerophosphoryl diester phosphodiesterase
MQIISHRGIDATHYPDVTESSQQAFDTQLELGFSIEFDVQFTLDNEIIINHDADLRKMSQNKTTTDIATLTKAKISKLIYQNTTILGIEDLIKQVNTRGNTNAVHAIHLKGVHQTREKIDTLLQKLTRLPTEKYFIFDLTVAAAKYIKSIDSGIQTGASLAHEYDIERFNKLTGGTLLSLDEVCANKGIFDWAWFDEWDTKDISDTSKKLYTDSNFSKVRHQNMSIAVISPELHKGTSIGGHPDASSQDQLMIRLSEIIALEPDAICTDYPSLVKELLHT